VLHIGYFSLHALWSVRNPATLAVSLFEFIPILPSELDRRRPADPDSETLAMRR
jgi:hypothetical protein